MSAWIVSRAHIDVIVNGLVQYNLILPTKASGIGRLLWRENHASVNYRYNETTKTPGYRFTSAGAPIHPAHLLMATGCYEYQSCEHSAWDSSPAKSWCEALAKAITETDPERVVEGRWTPEAKTSYGHDEGPGVRWGYESLAEALAPLS